MLSRPLFIRLQRMCHALEANALPVAFRILVGATLLTLLLNPSELFADATRGCDAFISLNAFCFDSRATFVRWAAIVVCCISLRPRVSRASILAQWIIAHSIRVSIATPDGGDSINANLSFLLIPLGLSVPEAFNYRLSSPLSDRQQMMVRWTRWLVAFQMAIVYFDAAIAKVYVPEWRDGTALYYILTMPGFGDIDIDSTVGAILRSPAVGMLTYGTLFLEFLLAFAWIGTATVRRAILLAAVGFHAAIALVMGLPTFALAMSAGLLIFLSSTENGGYGNPRLRPADDAIILD